MTDDKREFEIPFHSPDQLMLHQLRLLEWMATTGRKRFIDEDVPTEEVVTPPSVLPEKWQLTRGIKPYEWQEKCIANWFQNQGHGTVKVVTGGGKTLLALAIAECVQNTKDSELRVAIVVPTIVLMHQWYDALLEHGNLPKEAIGRLGDNVDSFRGLSRSPRCVGT
jgi:superfamily II DNA or RNA helicase